MINKILKDRRVMGLVGWPVLIMLFFLCIISCSVPKDTQPLTSGSAPEITQPLTSDHVSDATLPIINYSVIDDYFTMSKDELLEKCGPNYEMVPAGAEGSEEGYYYSDTDLVFVFSYDDMLETIWCGVGFEFNGARAGMKFEEIQEHLGPAEVMDTFVEIPENNAYVIEYTIDNCIYRFTSYNEDGSDSVFSIRRFIN